MTITAKYASRCGSCGQPVTPGQQIEWAKGSPVRHTSCDASVSASPVVSRPRLAHRSLTNGDLYTATNGARTVYGCAACRRLGRMCRRCQHDEDDN